MHVSRIVCSAIRALNTYTFDSRLLMLYLLVCVLFRCSTMFQSSRFEACISAEQGPMFKAQGFPLHGWQNIWFVQKEQVCLKRFTCFANCVFRNPCIVNITMFDSCSASFRYGCICLCKSFHFWSSFEFSRFVACVSVGEVPAFRVQDSRLGFRMIQCPGFRVCMFRISKRFVSSITLY